MQDQTKATTESLVHANNSSEALLMLYKHRKQENPKCSLSFFCKAAGISSTGYFSDVLNRRRTLHRKYRSSIVRAFGLEASAARCLKLLIDIDNERAEERQVRLRAKLALERKTLQISHRPMAPELNGLLFALEVFCALGLFNNRASLAELNAYFGKAEGGPVAQAVALLLSLGYIKQDGDHYTPSAEQIVFGEGPGQTTHLDFLKGALSHAAASVDRWFSTPELAFFASYMISVKRSEYETLLPIIKSRILRAHTELDAPDADMLVRFNVQLYPLGGSLGH